jgi:hypothetical protein
VADLTQDAIFADDVINLLEPQDFGFFKYFQGNVVTAGLVAGDADATK